MNQWAAMTEIPEKLADVLDALALIGDRQERIELLIDMADRFEAVAERIARRPFPESSRTPNCESEAFVFTEERPDGTLKFHFAVENPQGISAMAMAVILDETLSGAPVELVARVPADIIFQIFGNELSMGKSMGLTGMVQMVAGAARRRLRDSEPFDAARRQQVNADDG